MKKSGVRRGQTGTAALNFINNSLNPIYYNSYADYFVKYIKAYENEGIPVYSLSMQNESQNNPKWEACTWKPEEAAKFVGGYLGPALEANNINTKLLIWDWDKGNDLMHGDGFIKYNTTVLSDKNARKYIDGIAFHWYAGDVWHEIAGKPMWSKDFYSLDEIKERFPDINLYATEACQEKGPWLGSFEPADRSIETKSDMDIVKTAVKDNDGSISVLLGNITDNKKTVSVIDGGKAVEVTLLPHSLTTLRYQDDGEDYVIEEENEHKH